MMSCPAAFFLLLRYDVGYISADRILPAIEYAAACYIPTLNAYASTVAEHPPAMMLTIKAVPLKKAAASDPMSPTLTPLRTTNSMIMEKNPIAHQ